LIYSHNINIGGDNINKLYPTEYNNENYYIDKECNIYDFITLKNITIKFNKYQLATIMAYTFCGQFIFDILYKDGNDNNVSRKNIYYLIPNNFEQNIEAYGFRKINNFSRYYITKNGVIYSKSKRIILHHKIKKGGYHIISLYDDNNIRYTIFIHRLVYYTWSNNEIKNEYHINHLDGRPWNNWFDNLEETTPLENTRHAINIIKTRKNLWNNDEIELICKLLENGALPKEIYNKFSNKNISLSTIKELCHHLVYGTKFWKDISSKYNFDKYFENKYKYSNDIIHKVCQLLEKNITPLQIEKITNVPLKYVCDIKYGNVRKSISKLYKINKSNK